MDKPNINELVAEEIRVLLARRRMSASDLARQTGMTQRAISRRLTGEKIIDVDDLARIAKAFGVEAADLLPRPSEGRTVVVAGEPRRQTTVAKAELPKRSRLNGLPTNSVPRESTRRPVMLVPAYA